MELRVQQMSHTYLNEKRAAYKLIDDLYTQGKSIDEILLAVQTSYGFGRKIVEERLELLKSSHGGGKWEKYQGR